ncbi:MAG: indolepyruvate oxidoreductase subunit beta family protein [Hyphomicrobiales bacterium]
MNDRVIKLAVMAVGGQGGGVITGWIVALAERNGWYAQATSVPGVAQRTGATIYYVELTPEKAKIPVLSLMPSPGDVDILLAAELMEAGRAMQRGFVSPGRTVLIASSHRILAVSEKAPPGDCTADAAAVHDAARKNARRFVCADLEVIARKHGSVISASLFGALAGAKVLPFEDASFETTILGGGKGVERSLAAFREGRDAISAAPHEKEAAAAPAALQGPAHMLRGYRDLIAGMQRRFPSAAHAMLKAGLNKTVDFQDLDYGREYFDRVAALLPLDGAAQGHVLTIEAAKYLANAMCYDDIIRVADLKTRAVRFARIDREFGGDILRITEYMHPRAEEMCSLMPARIGAAIMARAKLLRLLDRAVNRGHHVKTTSLLWFTVLYLLAGLRRVRRRLLRHRIEMASIAAWLAKVEALAPRRYDFAVELLRCRRLIKGYSDTHARGLSKYDRVLSALPLLEHRDDGAAWLRRLREAAMQDEDGTGLDGVLATVRDL